MVLDYFSNFFALKSAANFFFQNNFIFDFTINMFSPKVIIIACTTFDKSWNQKPVLKFVVYMCWYLSVISALKLRKDNVKKVTGRSKNTLFNYFIWRSFAERILNVWVQEHSKIQSLSIYSELFLYEMG